MNDDELRDRLARLDPLAHVPVTSVTSPRAQELLEQTMLTDPQTDTPSPTTRRWPLIASAAAAVLLAGGIALAVGGGSEPAPTIAKKKTTLALNLPAAAAGGPSLNTCIMLSAEFLKQMPVAFAGTVSAVDAGVVSLDVTRWYVGGTAQVVTLANNNGPEVTLEGGTEFAVGKDYLVSASDGTVSSCGFSGPATPELQKVYTEAFS